MRRPVSRIVLGVSGLAAGVLAAFPGVALAAPPPSVPTCTAGVGDVDALITYIDYLNGNGGGSVTLPSNCTFSATSAITMTSNAMPVITKAITLIGSNTKIVRDSASLFRIFEVGSGGELTMRGITVADGDVSGDGGCYLVDAQDSLMLVHSPVMNCAAGDDGGGIYAVGGVFAHVRGTRRQAPVDGGYDVTIEKSALTGNHADGEGGALFVGATGTAYLLKDYIGNNSADDGGGIYNAGSATVLSSMLTLNSAVTNGGGIVNTSLRTLILQGSTVIRNSAGEDGGGIYNSGEQALRNTVVTANTAAAGGGIYENVVDTTLLMISPVTANFPDNCEPLGSITNCFG